MTRVGWVVLALVLLVVAGFLATTRFSGPSPTARPGEKVVDHLERVVRARFGGGAAAMPPTAARAPGLLVVPLAGVPRGALQDTWGQARSEGRVHHGTDIMAAGGTPVLAAADGTIEKLFQSRLGGLTLYERSPDRRWTFYYAHLSGYAPGIVEGAQVHAGQQIAMVGDTGDAGPGNYHLHFGLTRTDPAQHWYQGEDVNAFPYLVGALLPR